MNVFFKSWKLLKKELGMTELLDALFASLFYSLFILTPTVLIFGQIISMYYYMLNFWVVLIMLVSIGISMLQLLMWKKTILLKKKDLSVNINQLFTQLLIVYSIIIIVVGILFIFIFIPMMQI